MAPRRTAILLLGLLAPGLGALRCTGWPLPSGPVVVAVPAPGPVQRWRRFEIFVGIHPPARQPMDPAEVDLAGEFRSPDGTLFRVPGFYTLDFDHFLVGGFGRFAGRGWPHFAVRFSPPEEGVWTWRVHLRTPAGEAWTPWEEVRVGPAPPGEHGFLRISPLDPRYLRFDDGTPYLALGENLAWYGDRTVFDYEAWFERLAAEGMTFARIWMPSWAMGIEWESLGDYRLRLGQASQLDRVFELAERHGIYLMLCIQNHGPFSLTANSEWSGNPYNAARGGPLAHPREVFTDPVARDFFRRRLRYLVARWGYSTHLLAWELWNEVDLVPGGTTAESRLWHREMAEELRALDPHDHLITTSVAFPFVRDPLFDLPEIEITQIHFYPPTGPVPMASTLADLVDGQHRSDRPILVGEYGVDYRGPAETLARDPHAIGFHDGLWAPLLSGAAGTGMSWWWDNVVDPEDLYFHFGPVATFVSGIAFDEQGFRALRPPAGSPDRPLEAYALVGPRMALLFVRNARHQFFPLDGGPDFAPVSGGFVDVAGLAPGTYRLRFLDPYTGLFREGAPLAVPGRGPVRVALPEFSADVAVRIEPLP